jgi:regulator of Ty1 transposition protein 109
LCSLSLAIYFWYTFLWDAMCRKHRRLWRHHNLGVLVQGSNLHATRVHRDPCSRPGIIMALRDALLQSLETVPGNRTFHLHVVVSVPRKHAGLFPYAYPRPRTHLQDILILLSEQAPDGGARILATAIEAALYIIPSTDSALLYVAKVDSTGQALVPSPTATLVRAFLAFHANPATRPIRMCHFWIHIFARSQTQYLFPNSADFEGKRVLSDIRLCAWWKKLLEDVGVACQRTESEQDTLTVHLSYLLPGMSELEAVQAIRASASLTASAEAPRWEYGQPFSCSGIPHPCPPPAKGKVNLGHFIPYFEDDPKSRFLDDIAFTTEAPLPQSPARKRRKLDHDVEEESDAPKPVPDEEATVARIRQAEGELGKVSVAEYWERMSFRQECVQGAITGFFALAVSAPATHPADTAPLAPRPGEVSLDVYHRIHTTLTKQNEFSTKGRAVRATEIVEGVIRSLCEAATDVGSDIARPSTSAPSSCDNAGAKTPEPSFALLNPLATPPRKPSADMLGTDTSPNPFSDPAPSQETYTGYIYGSIHTDNAPLLAKPAVQAPVTQPMTILAARKKKKKQADA